MGRIIIIVIASLLQVPKASASSPQPGEVGLFGYGSLINVDSMSRTLGRSYPTSRMTTMTLNNFRRTWSVGSENTVTYYFDEKQAVVPTLTVNLNITEAPGESVNGVVYWISEDELQGFDRRERHYDRIMVSTNPLVYTYVAKSKFRIDPAQVRSTRQGVVKLSYLETIRRGLLQQGEHFTREFLDSTAQFPARLVVADFRKVLSFDGDPCLGEQRLRSYGALTLVPKSLQPACNRLGYESQSLSALSCIR